MSRYYAAYVRGGFGLVITEGAYLDKHYSQTRTSQVGMAADEQQRGWRKVFKSVHEGAAPLILQPMQAGAFSQNLEHTLSLSSVEPKENLAASPPHGKLLRAEFLTFGQGEASFTCVGVRHAPHAPAKRLTAYIV